MTKPRRRSPKNAWHANKVMKKLRNGGLDRSLDKVFGRKK